MGGITCLWYPGLTSINEDLPMSCRDGIISGMKAKVSLTMMGEVGAIHISRGTEGW